MGYSRGVEIADRKKFRHALREVCTDFQLSYGTYDSDWETIRMMKIEIARRERHISDDMSMSSD